MSKIKRIMSEVKPYKNIFYDAFNKQICVKFVGDKEYTKIPWKKYYWVKDPSGKSPVKDLHGIPMLKKEFTDKETVKSLKDAKIPVAESDLREEVKWAHATYDKMELQANINDWNIGYYDIEIQTGVNDGFPKPEEAAFPINLITFYSSQTKDTYTWALNLDIKNSGIVHNIRNFTDELSMLKDWLKWFNAQSFDIITGWNSILFDMPYIINRIRNLRNSKRIKTEYERVLSPLGKAPVAKKIQDRKQLNALGASYEVPGLVHIDYMDLYKSFAKHDPLPSYSLNYVATLETGEGKLEYEGTINTIWQTDPQKFAEYNVVDVKSVVNIENKCQLFGLILEYAYDCLVTLDKVYNKVPTSEGYILKYIHNENVVMNDKEDHYEDWWHDEKMYEVKKPDGTIHFQNCEFENGDTDFEEFHVKAGYCYDYPGRYDDCMSFDITSSYPHHIMQFNISPEVCIKNPKKEDVESGKVILSDVNGVGFLRTSDAILPTIVKKVFDERVHYKNLMKEASKKGDSKMAAVYDARQGTKKIIINSIYGICLSRQFHLFNIDCARAITRCARVTLRDWLTGGLNKYYVSLKMMNDIEKYFNVKLKDKSPIKLVNREVCAVHNDTDSVYFSINEIKNRLISEGMKIETEEEHRKFYAVCENMFQDFFKKVLEMRAKASKTENKIKFNRENIFKNMFCFAKKLYIGEVIDSEGKPYPFSKPKHKIMGVPIKRSDMPEFCKEAAEKLAFSIAEGQGYEDSKKFILDIYDRFCEAGPEAVSATKSISEYQKYVKEPLQHYLKEGIHFDKGQTFNAKCALAYNYIIAKHKLPYVPINNGTKFKYVYVKSDKYPTIEAIAFIGKWPKEFNLWFEIDYDIMFRKTFIPLFESMFKVSRWIGEKDHISLETAGLDSFFC